MRLYWGTARESVGGAVFGYVKANIEAAHGALAAGATFDEDAPIAIHLTLPPFFTPIPGRLNVLWTMNESAHVPEWQWRDYDKADLLLVPSAWNADVMRHYTDRPIGIVPLGVDPVDFPHVSRARVGEKFRWLWNGVANTRKGLDELKAAWAYGPTPLAADPRAELYLKSSFAPDDDRVRGVALRGNIIIDNRTLSQAELLTLYADADGFVMPSQGEGWGLCLLEAMATGLPCVTICEAGVTAYTAGDVVRDVAHHACMRGIQRPGEGWHFEPQWQADVPDLARLMRAVMANPREARRLGIRAAKRAARFTWVAAGRRLLDVLKAHTRPEQEEEETHGSLQRA